MTLTASSREQYTCTTADCLKSCQTRRLLYRHMKKHSKPNKCRFCPKSFAWRAECKRHEQYRHTVGNQRFRCIPCNKSWSRKDRLRHHEKTVHEMEVSPIQNQLNEGVEEEQPSQQPSLVTQIPDIWHAASAGNIAVMRHLIENGIDISSKADDGSTPLHCAARTNQKAVVEILLQEGAEIVEKNLKDRTPLVEAVLGGGLEIVMLMLQSKSTMHGIHVQEAILAAIRVDHLPITIALMQHGGTESLQSVINFLVEALKSRASSLSVHLWEEVREHPLVTEENQRQIFGKAVKYGHVPIFKSLLPILNFIRPKNTSRHHLYDAIDGGHIAVVKLVLTDEMSDIKVMNATKDSELTPQSSGDSHWIIDSKRLHVNQVIDTHAEESLLHRAAVRGHIELTKLLLDNENIQVNKLNKLSETPISLASERGHIKVVRLLLEHKDIQINCTNRYRETPLHEAAWGGHAEVVRLLLKHKDVEINSSGSSQETPLHRAAWGGHAEVVKLLLEHKDIEINSSSSNRETPLHQAAWRGHTEVVRLLLEHKDIQINCTNWYRETPLHEAAWGGHAEVVRLLLKHKDVEINSSGSSQETPLHRAAWRGHAEVVRLLLEHNGIDTSIRSNDNHWDDERRNKTVLELATMRGHEAIVKLLLEHAAIDVSAHESVPGTANERDESFSDPAAMAATLPANSLEALGDWDIGMEERFTDSQSSPWNSGDHHVADETHFPTFESFWDTVL